MYHTLHWLPIKHVNTNNNATFILITRGIVDIYLHFLRIESTRALVRLYKDRRSKNEDSRVCSYCHCVILSPFLHRHSTTCRRPDCIYPTSPDITVRPKISSRRTLNPPHNLDFVFGADRAKRHVGEPRKFSVHETPPVNFLP